jgi:hypothetical protein
VIILVAILLLANILFDGLLGKALSFDFSMSGNNSLSQESIDYINSLPQDSNIRIIGLLDKPENLANSPYQYIVPLLDDYQAKSNGRITVEYINPEVYPSIINQLDPKGVYDLISGNYVVAYNNNVKVISPYDCFAYDNSQSTSYAMVPTANNVEYTFTNATVETAGTGLELRAGTLNIKGGTITSTCTQDATMHAGGSGSCAVATGISVTQHSTKKKLVVNIEDTVVKAKAAIFEGNPSSYPTATEDTTINVVSGTFVGEVKTLNKDSDCKGFLKGGRYSVAPDEAYIAKGFKVVETSMGSFDIVAE